MADQQQTLWTVKEVGHFLGLKPKSIYAMAQDRRIPHVRISNRVRFYRDEVLSWASEKRVLTMEHTPWSHEK